MKQLNRKRNEKKSLFKEIVKADALHNKASVQNQNLCRLMLSYIDFSDFAETVVDVDTYKDDISVEMSTDGLVFVDYFARNIYLRDVYDKIIDNKKISYCDFISFSI